MERKVTFYKVLNESGYSCHGDTVKWFLPTLSRNGSWTPGEWMNPADGELKECSNGYHVVDVRQLLNRLGPRIFKAEVGREVVDCGDECVVQECRLVRECTGWTEDAARKFASNCVEYVLELYEIMYPDNAYLFSAVDAARFLTNAFACREAYVHKINYDHTRQWVHDIFSRSVESKAMCTREVDSHHSRLIALSGMFASLTDGSAVSAAKLTARAARNVVYTTVLADTLADNSVEIEEARAVAKKAEGEAEEWQASRLSRILEV